MKELLKCSPKWRYGGRRGFALVVILGAVVLVTLLVGGFLVRAKTELAASSGFKASAVARQLADRSVNLVQGQINLATTEGAAVAWASQPGMVRTFNNSDGSLIHAYKLYSAPAMISTSVNLSSDQPPSTWADMPGEWVDLNAPITVGGVKNYPILDPSALFTPGATPPKGFSITAAPGVTASSYQQAPMPVRWLYALKDGSLVTPSTSTGNTSTIPGATADNPIVGRLAFWTDDDSCKVNINTASQGTYWDTPHAASTQEVDFAQYQPAQKEWQRYPGHPAMTNLSAVFPDLTSAQIYAIVPRIVGGGSNAGTAIASAPLTPDSDRLYASVDELIFKSDRTANTGLNKTEVERAKFFLTARSRAPETTLSNLPRIACWPIYRLNGTGTPDVARTSAFDRLIAFCASTGTVGSSNYAPYIFQRQQASSTTNDISIARNSKLYEYLRHLTSQSAPGFGGNFSTKYGQDRDQILTEIFDYIRSANLRDDLLASNMGYTPSAAGIGWVAPTKYTSAGGVNTLGFGRSYTASELALGIICNASSDFALSNMPAINPVLGGTPLAPGEKYIQGIMFPEFFSVMQGWVQILPLMRVKIKGLDTVRVTVGTTTYNLFDNLDSEVATLSSTGAGTMITNWGGNPGYRYFGLAAGSPARGNLGADTTAAIYPYIGKILKINEPASGTMTLLGGANVTVEIYAGNTGALDATTLIQILNINIPSDISMPTPKVAQTTIGTATLQNWWNYTAKNGRLAMIGNNLNAGGTFFQDTYDTVRTFIPKHGDYRLIAGNSVVPSTEFVPHPYALSDPTRRTAANLGSTDPIAWLPGADERGSYIQGLTYSGPGTPAYTGFRPDMPYLVSASSDWPDVTGDWDTGISVATDGAYVNKPDEGNIQNLGVGTNIPYFDFAYFATAGGSTFFSPNRQIPSPGMFGSLSTGVKAGIPWRTLLFRPQAGHFGATSPSDHLFLDLFWMPVVEPYAISDRFSTAGKINMNYQLMPFTYITRSTGLQALFDSEKVAAIPVSSVGTYKPNIRNASWKTTAASNPDFRLALNSTETLSQFEEVFTAGSIFKSASEICDIHMVPTGKTVADMSGTFWTTHALTGDNMKERIYTTLYPRLTTKSNTFTVHFRAQTLQKNKTGQADIWVEGRDGVTGEYRGLTTIERFIDANNPNIPDYAADPATIGTPLMPTLDTFYKWRVVQNRQFAP